MATIANQFGSMISLFAPALAVAIVGRTTSTMAYSDPPSWDPMLMLNVRLDSQNNLSVESAPEPVRLNPAPSTYDPLTQTYNLSVVSFDPAQPWSVLNGTAYSRVLGWYDQGTTGANGDDFYNTYYEQLAGNSLWIEKIEGSPPLKTYFVDEASSWNEEANGPYTPIFGADGSSTRWRWDGFMDHNAYAVDLKDITAPNQVFTATYRLYVGDARGNAVAGYGDTTTTWTWQGPAVASVQATSTILSNVPMQGAMLMPVVSYHAANGTVTVDLSDIEVTAQLTPLLVSNPSNRFHPADPWFDSLDPSRQGLAFSRRYGFTMDANTDALPVGKQLWIRKSSGSPELSIYRYSSSAPKTWTPIFGTASTTNALYWNGVMFHPGIAAPAGTNTYSATFEVYVLDTATGQEAPGSSSEPFVLNWTDVPDGRPRLDIAVDAADRIVLAWPTNVANWALVSSGSLNSTNWGVVTNITTILNGQSTVTLDSPEMSQFFRMRLNP